MDKKIISEEEIEHIAHLSRIELRDDDKEKFTHQLNEIVGYINILQKVNTSGIDPTFLTAPLFNKFRKDKPTPSLETFEVLRNAPQKEGDFFKMPRILKKCEKS